MSTGSSGSTSTVTQKADPWKEAQPYLTDIMKQAQDVYRNVPFGFFPGQTFVPMSGNTQFGQQALGAAAGNQGQLLGQAGYSINNILSGQDPFMQQLGATAQGNYLNGSPALDDLYQSMASRIGDQVGAQFSAAGRYGSGKYVDALGRSLGDLGAQIYGQNYTQERANQLNAASQGIEKQIQASAFLPQLAQAQAMPGQTLLQMGALDESYQGMALKDAMDRFYALQQNPWDQLNQYNAVIQGFGGLGGQSTTATTQPGVSPLAGALGGLSGGLGIASSLGGMGLLGSAGAASPWGWALGGLGLLGGLFGGG